MAAHYIGMAIQPWSIIQYLGYSLTINVSISYILKIYISMAIDCIDMAANCTNVAVNANLQYTTK